MKSKKNKATKTVKRKKKRTSKKVDRSKINPKNGRPTKFSKLNLIVIKNLVSEGKTEKYISKLLGVSEQTFNNWKHQNPKFFDDLKDWRIDAIKKVERTMYDNANGYEHDSEHISTYEGRVIRTKIKKKYQPSQKAAEFILANKDPDNYKRAGKDELPEGITDDIKLVYNIDEL